MWLILNFSRTSDGDNGESRFDKVSRCFINFSSSTVLRRRVQLKQRMQNPAYASSRQLGWYERDYLISTLSSHLPVVTSQRPILGHRYNQPTLSSCTPRRHSWSTSSSPSRQPSTSTSYHVRQRPQRLRRARQTRRRNLPRPHHFTAFRKDKSARSSETTLFRSSRHA